MGLTMQEHPEYHKTDLVHMIADAQRKMLLALSNASASNESHECVVLKGSEGCTHAPTAASGTSVDDRGNPWSAACAPSSSTDDASSSPRLGIDGFSYEDLIKIQAPMVRCSRPPFRKLCRLWGTTISYTHMIMSDSFSRSAEARASDFALYRGEDRLVVQLAGTSGPTMASAASMLAPFCDAIDINCGCPQKWAMKEGIGSALLEKPELVADMVKSIWNAVPGALLPCVVKMRVYDDVSKSVDFARQVAAAGASWVSVHGRTPWDTQSAIVRTSVIATIRDAIEVPVVANGSVESPRSALGLALDAGVGSVMCARGLLSNPAAFYVPHDHESLTFRTTSPILPMTEHPATNPATAAIEVAHPCLRRVSSSVVCPIEVISDFMRLAAMCNLPLKATQHHLLLMAHSYLSPTERSYISQVRSNTSLFRALDEAGLYTPNGKVLIS